MEDYAAKMQLKPDAALRDYVTSHAQYREEAVLAAFDELRRRGQPAPEEAALRPVVEAALAASQQAAAAASKEAVRRRPALNPENPEATGPALYSPGTILLFSLFFSLLAGGALLGINLGKLKRWGALAGLGLFLVGYLLASAAALTWLAARFGLNPLLSLVLNVPAVLAYLLWFWPRYVGADPYRSRGWLLPFVVCIVGALALQAGNKYLLKHQPRQVRQEMEKIFGK